MRTSYRKALDSGIATFFDSYNQIWSGSPATESMSSGLVGAADSTDTRSHSFESSTENTISQSRSWTLQETCNNDRPDESNEDQDTESSLKSENTNDIEGKKKKSSREKMK